MRRTGDVLRALTLSAFLTAACSDPPAGGLPPTSPPVTSATSPGTPSASPSTTGERALAAAARHFYATLGAAGAEPDKHTDDVAALISDRCDCRRIVEFLRDQARQGRHIERSVSVTDLRVARGGNGAGTVFLTLVQGAGRVVDSRGRVVERLAASRDDVVLDFEAVRGRLLVRRISTSGS
jgi:hypothetical protein